MASSHIAGTRFGVVVVNYNGGAMLLEAIASALREGVAASNIAVVDNGSSDNSMAELTTAHPGVQTLFNGCNAGFARAVNAGVRRLATEFILLLNNDAQLEPGALARLADAFDQQPTAAIAGGQLRYPDGRLQSAFAPLPSLREELFSTALLCRLHPERYRKFSATDDTREVESVYGACLALRASSLASIGLLDEDFFFYYEEVDWCRRARLAGFRILHVPSARVVHRWGHTANQFRAGARIELQRAKLLYFRKSSSAGGYALINVLMLLSTVFNALTNTLAVALTLGLAARQRARTAMYLHILAWHLRGRPGTWGLPGKCPAR